MNVKFCHCARRYPPNDGSTTDSIDESFIRLGFQPGFNLLQPVLQLSCLSVIQRKRVDRGFYLTLLELARQMSGKPGGAFL